MKSKGAHNIFHRTPKYLESVHKPVSANFKETTFFITTTYFIQHMFDLLEIDGFVKSTNHVILRSLRRRIGLDWCVSLKRFFGRSSLRMTTSGLFTRLSYFCYETPSLFNRVNIYTTTNNFICQFLYFFFFHFSLFPLFPYLHLHN